MLAEAASSGGSISAVARKYGIVPNMMFRSKRAMDDAGDAGLKSNEKVYPESEVKKLKARIAELERALGCTTEDNEILNYEVEVAVEKSGCRPHDGEVVTLKSDPRWGTDMFEIRAWSWGKVYVAFATDCCDREILSYMGESRHLDCADVRDWMAKAVEACCGDFRTPHPIER